MATMEGSLSKWTNVMKGWQYRWFVLDDNAGLLSYYTSREKMMRGVRRGCVRLKGAVIGIDDEDVSTFTITVDSKTFHFQARDGDEKEKWVRCLENTIARHGYGYKCPSTLRLDSVKPSPTMQDFDKKLAEADAYLQILIDQTKALEVKMKPYENDDKLICEEIWNHANKMLEQVKHTIVLLQIAKNTAHPVNGTYQPLDVSDASHKADGSVSFVLGSASVIEAGIELGSECIESQTQALLHPQNIPDSYSHGIQVHTTLPPPPVVPETSYSSSEEEDFYDAHDSSDGPSLSPPPSPNIHDGFDGSRSGANEPPDVEEQKTEGHPTSTSSKFIKQDGTLDYDAMYEDPNESDISMESQGSVVTHLLSQVKIGMDLTKVVLPTFILERRSLLEMYADYFAHPDMFVRIAELNSERERMIQVVKWYICSYHAGRKSGVAKKPYNPILGEIFQCHWDMESSGDMSQVAVADGPIPWCHKHHLTFVAEQVSHHPPISAFYAEHFNKRISFTAHVWTKSKFLGLSICVHNVGQGVVDVIDHNEQYVVTFPNGYGRSILNVPWIELGGTVEISCAKTGYRAIIEFITKPFYGGKKHRISGEMYSPHEKKPFLCVSGEWNGAIEAKWPDGKTELFANVESLSTIKKIVRPIEHQAEHESRRLWREVTAGLRLNNVVHATNAKCEIEQKQRLQAQQRKDKGVSWETKLFHRDEYENWVYVNPLHERLKSVMTPTC